MHERLDMSLAGMGRERAEPANSGSGRSHGPGGHGTARHGTARHGT